MVHKLVELFVVIIGVEVSSMGTVVLGNSCRVSLTHIYIQLEFPRGKFLKARRGYH